MLKKLIPEDCVTYEELADLAARHRKDCEVFRKARENGIKVKKEVLLFMVETTERIEKRMRELDDIYSERKASLVNEIIGYIE